MTAWTNDELERIGSAEELEIASLRRDGTLTDPVTIWVVRVDDGLYVRSYRAQRGKWYRDALVRHAGRISAGGVTKDVTYAEALDPALNDQIDAAYRAKYTGGNAEYVPPMLTPEVRATTLRLAPAA